MGGKNLASHPTARHTARTPQTKTSETKRPSVDCLGVRAPLSAEIGVDRDYPVLLPLIDSMMSTKTDELMSIKTGAAIKFTERDLDETSSIFASANSSIALRLQKDRSVRVSIDRSSVFVLGSVCLDTDEFRPNDQVKLMIRFLNDRSNSWSCLCNYLGSKRGGQVMLPLTQLGFEVMGDCVFEICAHATNDCILNISCNVLSATPADATVDDFQNNIRAASRTKNVIPDRQAQRARRELLKHLFFTSLLMLTFVNRSGGLTTSLPSLHPTHRITKSNDDKTIHAESPSISPSANSLMNQLDTRQSSDSNQTSSIFDENQVANTITSPAKSPGQNDCIDLTIALLPSWIGESDPVQWSINSDEVIWSKVYSDVELFNAIIVDNAADDGTCLLPGSYSFNMSVAGEAHYLLYSNGSVVTCGGFRKNSTLIDISLPIDKSKIEASCSTLVGCKDGNTDCVRQAFIPLQCYNNGTEVDVTASEWNSGGNRTTWFSGTCSEALNEMCESSALGFGVQNQSVLGYESFCPYFNCADTAFSKYLAGGTLDEFYSCECSYAAWSCAKAGSKCETNSCCLENDAASTTTGCACRIEPDCDDGNFEMCDVALDYCCITRENEFERRECETKYSRIKCQRSVEEKEIDENGDYPYCKQNAAQTCEGDVDESGCTCKYWEELCNQYPEEAVCEDAIDYCCPGEARLMAFCYCDFYSWSSTVGYTSEKMAGWCSTSETYNNQISNIQNDLFGLELIYRFLGGEFWYDNTGWMSNTTHCDWYGVQCNNERVTQILLGSNNLTGDLGVLGESLDPGSDTGSLFELQELDLSSNNIVGGIRSTSFFRHRLMTSFDVSNNRLEGIADILISPSIILANFSHNSFSTIGRILKSRMAYNSIETIDISHNFVQQEANDFFMAFPPNMKRIIVRNNELAGTLPMQLPEFIKMEVFDASENYLTGYLPDFSRSMPRVQKILLAGQKDSEIGGLTGSIPRATASLLDLLDLDLSNNDLTGGVLPTLGNIPRLKVLNLSNNELTGIISDELGRLSEVSKVFDLSHNNLSGGIPEKMKNFIDGAISLGGNELRGPAPLGLCYDATDFDLKNDPMFCPPERNALKDFFDTAKGGEWTVSTGWNDQFLEVCAWFGVTCNNETKQPIRLELNNNGLSGKLSDTFGALRSLEYIDISDNDIKGSIPSDLGSFENLKTLRLSYNQFSSTIPSQLLQLQNLELAHFQSNRLTGEISLNAELMLDPSSFISDCGVPTDFEDPLLCDGCTMCCNILGDCHTTEAPLLDIRSLTFVRFLSILLGSVGGILIVFTFIKCKFYNPRWSRSRKADITREKIIREKENAFNSIGKNSVYCFFLTKNYVGWIIALLVISFQFYVFLFFVVAAEKDFSDDKSDFTYSWRCPRNSIECNYIADQTWSGWVTFGILMLCHLGKDIVQGMKLIYMSTKSWHHRPRRLRFFVGGVLMILITITATYASTVYNYAIARSNADLVENAVIVLYLVDVDEQLYMLMEVMCPKFLKGLIGPVPSSSEDKPTPINPFDLSEEDVIQRTSGQYRPRRTPGQNRSQNSLQWSYINDEKEKTPPPNPSNPHIRWSYIEEEKKPLSMELESFNDNENGTQNDNLNRGKDISEIYEKLHKLELGKTSVDYSEDISKIFTKLHEMELLMSDKKSLGETTNGTNNNDALYQAQNDLYAKITAIERQTDDLRLALQVHKSSADLITDSVRYLHEKAIEMEELSQNSRSSGPHIT